VSKRILNSQSIPYKIIASVNLTLNRFNNKLTFIYQIRDWKYKYIKQIMRAGRLSRRPHYHRRLGRSGRREEEEYIMNNQCPNFTGSTYTCSIK